MGSNVRVPSRARGVRCSRILIVPKVPVSYPKVVAFQAAIALSTWPFWFLEYVDVDRVEQPLLGVLAILAGFLGILITIERNIDWLRQYTWRRASVEKRTASRAVNGQSILLLLYIMTIILIIARVALRPDLETARSILGMSYLVTGTLCLLWTLALPFEVRRMRLLPYQDLMTEKLPHSSTGNDG
jgi:hypothetical protein